MEKGLTNLEFFVSDAASVSREGYDLACIFDAWHDMGDPVGVAKAIKESLADDGTFMVVEPMALDGLKNNLENYPGAAMFYGFGTLVCVPASKAQPVGLGLGPQAGPKKLLELLSEAGFENVNLATQTDSNLVLQLLIDSYLVAKTSAQGVFLGCGFSSIFHRSCISVL